jgi:hypothetical protein
MELALLATEAEWAHAGPGLVDAAETFLLGTARALVTPPGRQILINGPDRILLFVVGQHTVKLAIFSVEYALTPS